MRQLLLLRHARAGSGLGSEDHERPLTEDGREDAKRMGAFLVGRSLHPDLALCSSARRARETLEALQSHGGDVAAVALERELYEADAHGLLRRLRAVDDGVQRCLLVAHQPAIGELSAQLASEADPAALGRLRHGLSPGALALFEVSGPGWGDLDPGQTRLLDFVAPQDLAGMSEGGRP
ncbi:MAG: histidine phosphatase family protein [Myxococcota bacterium]